MASLTPIGGQRRNSFIFGISAATSGFPEVDFGVIETIFGGATMPSWDEALCRAQGLLERMDAFAARRARRDGDDPSSSPGAPPDLREDNDLEERPELRTGALSKAE
jgi:hypothetical protein